MLVCFVTLFQRTYLEDLPRSTNSERNAVHANNGMPPTNKNDFLLCDEAWMTQRMVVLSEVRHAPKPRNPQPHIHVDIEGSCFCQGKNEHWFKEIRKRESERGKVGH